MGVWYHIHFCEAKYYLQTTVGRKTDENFLEEGNEEMGRSISDLLAPSLLTMQKENVRKMELQLKATPIWVTWEKRRPRP